MWFCVVWSCPHATCSSMHHPPPTPFVSPSPSTFHYLPPPPIPLLLSPQDALLSPLPPTATDRDTMPGFRGGGSGGSAHGSSGSLTPPPLAPHTQPHHHHHHHTHTHTSYPISFLQPSSPPLACTHTLPHTTVPPRPPPPGTLSRLTVRQVSLTPATPCTSATGLSAT